MKESKKIGGVKQMKLDYTIESPEERNKLVTKIIEETEKNSY